MAKHSRVKYRPQTQDGGRLRTEEQQAYLLADAAYRVWRKWSRVDENGQNASVQGQDKELDQAMRLLYGQIKETDVFYSGYNMARERSDG